MKRLGTVVCLALLPACAPLPLIHQQHSASLDFKAVAGSWNGTVYQRDTRSTYPVKLKVNAAPMVGKSAGSSDYPSLGCGGTLVAVRREGRTAVVREVLRYGQEACLDNILLYLTPNRNGTLTYAFYQSGELSLSQPNGRGVLRKQISPFR
ncbi:hypothetical protein [Deinococcus sp. UYEF24]